MRPKEFIQIKLTKRCMRRIGIELLEVKSSPLRGVTAVRLQCLTCGLEWSPKIVPGLYKSRHWWWCPKNPEHTRAKARTDFGKAYHEQALKRAAEAVKDEEGPVQGQLF